MDGRADLVGRDREVASLTALLDDPAREGLVLTGEAGLGKSTLWRLALDMASERGATVLRAAPAAGEQRHSYGVLLDLIGDLSLSDLGLRPAVREALDAVLLRSGAPAQVDPRVVPSGVLDVLSALATRGWLVVAIDDAQWSDTASTEALAYAARRLAGAHVQFLFTRRAGFERGPLETALARRDLGYLEPRPLTVDETARLLRRRLELSLSPRSLRLVHEQTGGNPLFVLEVGRVLLERGVPEIGRPLGVPAEMATMFGLRVRALAEDQRTLLLAVALDPHVAETALVSLVGADAVERAARDQLLAVSADGRARAWHPLLAAAVREESTPARRRDLHHRLAGLVEPIESRLRHRALALAAPDEEVARLLSAAAGAAGTRGATETSLDLAELALTATPIGSSYRTGRVLDLASRMGRANEARQLTEFLEPEIARMELGPDRGRAWLMLLDGMVGDVANMDRIVDHALAESGGDPGVRSRALEVRSFIAAGIKVSGVAQAMAWAEESLAVAANGPEEWQLLGDSRDWCLVHSGRPPEGPEGPAHWKRLVWRGELDVAEAAVRRAIADADSSGRLQEAVSLQLGLCDVLTRSGRVLEARALADAFEDVDLTAKEPPDEELFRAEIEAASGDALAARRWGQLAHDRAVAWGHVWIELEAARALATAALRAGEPDEAVVRLRDVFDRTRGAGVREPGMFPVSAPLVEGLVVLGRYDEAREVLAWLADASEEQAHPWGTAMVERSRLLVGLLDGSVPAGQASVGTRQVASTLDGLGLRHDAGRAHLALGSALRRRRQWGLAQTHLDEAGSRFDALGAEGWAVAARSEADRVGGRRRRSEAGLSHAELATARLAADGLPNKAIARRLNVSISTVEAHLTRVYSRLGVRSRAQLATALAGHEAAANEPGGP